LVAGADEDKFKAAEIYAESIGLAFQIVDDLLDITSTSEELGKPVGSDEVNSKSTYPSLLGFQRSKELVNELTDRAVTAVSMLGDESAFLADYAVKLSIRTK
jgi:geranylgeranyl diphosphate synthase type II